MNTTKSALEASLKKLLLHKPIDKITIADLTADCGISRMSFYYHFKDIYDLAEWVCVEDGKRALQGKKTYDTWQEGMRQIFEAVMENRPFILNIYRGVGREKPPWWRKSAWGRSWLQRIRRLSRSFINLALWGSCWTGSTGG